MHEGESPQENEDRHVSNVFANEHKPNLLGDSWPCKSAEGVYARIKRDKHERYQLEGPNDAV